MLSHVNRVLLRVPVAQGTTGYSRSAYYAMTAAGLLPPLVKISSRASAVPAHELEQVNAARIAGRTDDEIRALVRRLHASRSTLAA
jgi:prophage regulatory protein